MLEGRDAAGRVVAEVEEWCREHEIRSIDDIKGKALENLKSFDEMKIEACREYGEKCTLHGKLREMQDSLFIRSNKKRKRHGCGG